MALDTAGMLNFVDVTTILVFLLALLIYFLYRSSKLPENFPPGPRPWPIVGTLPFTSKHFPVFHKTTMELREKYGPIIGFKMGKYPAVVLASQDVIQEALVQKSDSFSSRPDFLYVVKQMISAGGEVRGIIMRDGETWKRLRRFSLTSMRDLGVGKRSVEAKICEEADILCQEVSKNVGRPYNIDDMTHRAVSNIICQVCFGLRYEYRDPVFNHLLSNVNVLFENNAFASVINYIPVLRYAPFSGWYRKMDKSSRMIDDFIDSQIESHRDSFHASNIRDMMDLYLLKENDMENGKLTLDRFDVYASIRDLFIAGTDTSTTTIKWLLLYMIHYPDIQTRCQQEIDDIIGMNNTPAVSDRQKLPYIEATIHEAQRLGNIANFAIPHATNCEVKLGRYTIPKQTLVLANLYSVHMDTTLWKEPNKFLPERWISPDGKFTKRNGFIPFSVGPRSCPGEGLAKMEIFLFFTTLLQKFRFEMVDSGEPPSMEGIQHITFSPPSYELIVKQR